MDRLQVAVVAFDLITQLLFISTIAPFLHSMTIHKPLPLSTTLFILHFDVIMWNNHLKHTIVSSPDGTSKRYLATLHHFEYVSCPLNGIG
jgi:hypothetical protein